MGHNGKWHKSTSKNTGDLKMSISNEQITAMRASGQITDQEIAIQEVDLIIAKNVVTEARRIIGSANDVLTESNQRRVLKG